MDFEWDGAKEQANRKKHGVDFRTAAKVFLDPYVIEFDDLAAADELRFQCYRLGRRSDALSHLRDERRRRPNHIRQRSGVA
jgi:uncharacterized DUF497 family protein